MARASITITGNEGIDKFLGNINATLDKIASGTKKYATQAATQILEESLKQVPRYTGTLASSAYSNVSKSSLWGYEATVGYGGEADKYNISKGMYASEYMVKVHEDLTVSHHNGGKAKFLEDPVREFMHSNFPRSMINFTTDIAEELMHE